MTNAFKNKVSGQALFDTLKPTNIEREVKISGAEEMVMMFIRNYPKSVGRSFLLDVLNSYKAVMRNE